MSDHDFEKQVRQKLNNLKITPSAEAWEKIEQRLRERRRRRSLLWLPLLLAGLAVGGYYLYPSLLHPHSGSRQTTVPVNAVSGTTAHKDLAAAEADKNATPGNDVPGSDIPGLDRSKATTAENDDSITDGNSLTQQKDGPSSLAIVRQAMERSERKRKAQPGQRSSPVTSSKHHHATQKSTSIEASETSDDHPNVMVSENAGQPPAIPANDQASIAYNAPPVVVSVHAQKILPTALLPAAAENSPPAPVVKKAPATAHSKWSYAIDVHTGISGVNRNALVPRKSMVAAADYPTSGFVAVVANYAPVYKPAITSPGLAFSVGLEVKRELSKRFSLSTGLGYTQLNTLLKAGEQYINTQTAYGLRSYVLSSAAMVRNEVKEYRNKYHFVELPVVLNMRLIGNEELPVYWNAGVVISQLLSSASVHFDAANGIYYEDNGLVNQTQVGVTTGFSLALFNKTPHPLWLGPSVRSNISSVLKKDAADNRRFVALGLDVKWFWRK